MNQISKHIISFVMPIIKWTLNILIVLFFFIQIPTYIDIFYNIEKYCSN